jgi:hypothetical protein
MHLNEVCNRYNEYLPAYVESSGCPAFVVEATPFLHSRFGREAVEKADAVGFYINENSIFKWMHF